MVETRRQSRAREARQAQQARQLESRRVRPPRPILPTIEDFNDELRQRIVHREIQLRSVCFIVSCVFFINSTIGSFNDRYSNEIFSNKILQVNDRVLAPPVPPENPLEIFMRSVRAAAQNLKHVEVRRESGVILID